MVKRLEETSHQTDGNKHIERWSMSLAIRETQIKATMRYHTTHLSEQLK